ncbi:MAG: hypothetical protein IJ317_05565 [Clostridia bacterium]|nr:hypothetical protein [Clostridia bacterium]
MKKRHTLIAVVASSAVLAVAAGVANFSTTTINADQATPFTGEQTLYVDANGNLYAQETDGATKVDFKLEMEYGAAVRLVENEGNGLRFTTYVDATAYNALSKAVEAGNVSLGALIGPTYLVGDELTFEDDEEFYQDVTQTEKGWETQAANGYYAYYSAIYNVPTAALNMNFTAQSYAKFTLADESTVVAYAKNAAAETDDVQASNVRSVKYVADKALADPEANLSEENENTLTAFSEMKEDGVTFNAAVAGATNAKTDENGAYGSVYSVAFDGSNSITFEGNLYTEFKVKFNETVSLSEMLPAGNVTIYKNGEFGGEAPAGEWTSVIVSGETFSVNKAVNATLFDVKNYTGKWAADNERYLLELVGGIDASKLTVGSSDEHFTAEKPAAIAKFATYKGVQEIAMRVPSNGYASLSQTAHVFNWTTTNTDFWHSMSPQVHLTSAVSKTELQTLLAKGYKTVSFKIAIAKDETDENGENYYKVDLAKVNTLLESGVTVDEARTTISGDIKSYMTAASWMYRNCWKTCTYSLEDLVACYDVLDLVPLFYEVFQGSQTAPTFCNVYITDFTLSREIAAPVISIDGVAVEDAVIFAQAGALNAAVNAPYELKLNDEKFVSGAVLATGTYTLSASSAYSAQTASVKLVIANDLNNLSGFVDMSKLTVGTTDNNIYYAAPGIVAKYATYTGLQENVAFKQYNSETLGTAKTAHIWSYSGTYAHYAGPQMHFTSAITKAELQALLDAGYTTMSFDFTVSQGVDDNKTGDDYYKLDFEKIKAMIESSTDMDAAKATVEKSFTAWANTAHNDYMKKSWMYRSSWKTVTYNVADLIACYEVLDLLPLFYDYITATTYNVYITDFTFTKS